MKILRLGKSMKVIDIEKKTPSFSVGEIVHTIYNNDYWEIVRFTPLDHVLLKRESDGLPLELPISSIREL